jgi:hypothetical protein
MGFLKSKSKQKAQAQSTSSSYNQAFPLLQQQLGDSVGLSTSSGNAIADLLGLNGGGGGFENYLDSTGYKFIRDEGNRDIDAGLASSGLFHSGS